MSIQSPLKDGIYIRQVRPDRSWIRYFVKHYQTIVGIILSLVVLLSLIQVEPLLGLALAGVYWVYVMVKKLISKSTALKPLYFHPFTQSLRVIALISAVSVGLYIIYTQTSYLTIIHNDVLWLLFFPAIVITTQSGSRLIFFGVVCLVVICIFIVDYSTSLFLHSPFTTMTLEFILKSFWIILLSLIFYILLRYMGDAVADLQLIINVQKRMREMEGTLLHSKVELDEHNYLEKAVEIIKDDLFFDHVNIFRLDRFKKELECVAGACAGGKELACSGFLVSIENQDSIITNVIKTGKHYISNNVLIDPHYLPHKAFPYTRSELVIPIRVRDRLYGVLDIQVDHKDFFLEQDIQAIEILVNHIGWMIDNSEQYDHISWTNRMIETIAGPIFTQNHLDETLQEIADSARKELNADLVFLYSYDPSIPNGLSGPIYSGMLLHPEIMDTSPSDPDNVVNKLLNNGERIYLHEDLYQVSLNNHPLFKPSTIHTRHGRPTFIEREQIKSNVIIRLLSDEKCVGILFLNFRRSRTFSNWDKKRYNSFANLAAMAIQKMHFQQHITQKGLTDLSNWIHDIFLGDTLGIFKILRSIDLSEENIDREKVKNKVHLAMKAAEHLHNDIRRFNSLLQNSTTGDMLEELDRLILFFKMIFNIEIVTKWTGDISLMPNNVAKEMFIVIREALTNAVRHGRAKNIELSGNIKDGNLNATIRDDGTGFNPSMVKRMNGLLSMNYRIQEMGGKFKLTSNPGKGTRISIKVPLLGSIEGEV